MRNGSFLLLYSKVLKCADTPQYQSNKSNLVNCNIGKWDFHSIVFQGAENTPPRKKTPQSQSKSHHLFSGTGKHWKYWKEIKKI